MSASGQGFTNESEMAKRIAELEEQVRSWATQSQKNGTRCIVAQGKVRELEQENQRYREALEAIADGTFEEWEMAGVAKKALEIT